MSCRARSVACLCPCLPAPHALPLALPGMLTPRPARQVFMLMRKGAAGRTTGATKLNEASSRSHAIFMLTVEKAVLLDDGPGGASAAGLAAAMELAGVPGTGPALRQTVRVGKLNLVDLAGSERVHVTGATGQRLEESKKINQSLSTLGNVISALAGGARAGREGKPHVPYRWVGGV